LPQFLTTRETAGKTPKHGLGDKSVRICRFYWWGVMQLHSTRFGISCLRLPWQLSNTLGGKEGGIIRNHERITAGY
jgi:hypothetical protein